MHHNTKLGLDYNLDKDQLVKCKNTELYLQLYLYIYLFNDHEETNRKVSLRKWYEVMRKPLLLYKVLTDST